MLQLTDNGLINKDEWLSKGYSLPKYDRAAMVAATKEAPYWIHFGAGNIFRAFQCNVVEELLNDGDLTKGITVAEGYDYEIIKKMNEPHDNLSILVTLKSTGSVDKVVVGSVAEALPLDSNNDTAFNRLKEIFTKDSLMMASFTITEKGYSLVNGAGEIQPDIKTDMENGPAKPISYLGKVVALLYARYEAGAKPISLVSMDNCSHNGDKVYAAVSAFAKAWSEKGLVPKDFVSYINDKNKVGYPWSMIDKITPRPDPSIQTMLIDDGLENPQPIITSKNTYVAPFVNAEETQYLVIEDWFPNGKPEALAKKGIIYTDRTTVDKIEKMKVCTCLNPLHTALAVTGCLLGYTLISEEMKDPDLVKLIEKIGYTEGLPVVVNPGIINPKDFIDTVVKVRLPNPFMPDAPQRIATDTSQKLAIRFGETVKAYIRDGLSLDNLKVIPFVYAAWLRYLMAIDDKGNKFELSSDPLLDIVCPVVSNIRLGDKINSKEVLKPILTNEQIFGYNLYESELCDRTCDYFEKLIAGPNAVRNTLNSL